MSLLRSKEAFGWVLLNGAFGLGLAGAWIHSVPLVAVALVLGFISVVFS